MILVVGNLRRWELRGRQAPSLEGFRFVVFEAVTSELIEEVHPDVVLSALMDEAFDAVDLARVLGAVGFGGRYRAVTIAIPNPQAVRAEVRAVAPDLDFDLFVLDTAVH